MSATRHNRTARSRHITACAAFALVLLAACSPKDYAGNPRLSPTKDLAMPSIVPLDPLLAQISPGVDPANPDPELAQQGADLRARAITETTPTAEEIQDEATWTAQGEALRARAEAARQAAP